MPTDFSMRVMNGVHRAIMTVTGGRRGWNLGGMPVLELTTTGRKSGQRRSTMLTAPLVLGDSYVVVASRGGDDVHPAWFLNLRDNPEVDVVIEGRPSEHRVARILTGDERAKLWSQIAATHRNYAQYQTKTEREIPLVMLDPS
ncbi:MAG: nitroreductase family deazaflavin-dependent oxidoreductase [Salinibacterium sp.]|nr:nitroreductase family deazaflavin-dependent oxidoreductase [Salinibacterium sp.]